jgi:nucleoside phosphorylase
MTHRQRSREDYMVGWICALHIELAAAKAMLDEEHEDLEHDPHDDNLYLLGSIAGHNVVIVCLPAGRIGNNAAAAVASQMRAAFKGMRFGLMVGIGGGVPSDESDVRLGDVVVGIPQNTHGGVVQYDFGKATPGKFERTGHLNAPPTILLNAIQRIRANHALEKSTLSQHLSKVENITQFARANAGPDILYEAAYTHEKGPTCKACAADQEVKRDERMSDAVILHYGTIASGNCVMKDGEERDTISTKLGGVLCFEMEAAGLMNNFPCLTVRGICDYADSHKNKKWQPYAAAVAAASAKEVLVSIPAVHVARVQTIDKTLNNVVGM